MPVARWMHIEFPVRDYWVLPIWTAHNGARDRGRCADLPDETIELGLSVSTRLSMLPSLYRRVDKGTADVRAAVSKREAHHEWSATQDGFSFRIAETLLYEFLLDLDSLVFEVNSTCELMTDLFTQLYAHVGKPLPRTPAGLVIRDVLKAANQDPGWFLELDCHRNFFSHEGAPFFAVDLTNEKSGSLDLLIMKRNLRRFDDPTHFVRLSELALIVRGFEQSKAVIQEHLIDLFTTA